MAFIPPTSISTTSISTTSIPTTSIPQFAGISQPQLNQPISTQPQLNQPISTQPQFTGIFTNADSISNTNTNSQFSIPQFSQTQTQIPQSQISQSKKARIPKAPRVPKQSTPDKIQITESFDTTSATYQQFAPFINKSQKLYPYNTEELISPYEGECPLINSLLCQPQSTTNLLFFDSTLLSVKLTEFKDEPKRIYQVSLADLKKYYDTNPKAMLTFKSHYKITPQTIYAKNVNYYNSLVNTYQSYQTQIKQNPQLEAQYLSDMKKLSDSITYLDKEIKKLQTSINQLSQSKTTQVIYNTATYPITDKSGKWLTVSYLIPYLMFASPRFINHTSNLLNNLLIATSYNLKIGTNDVHEPVYLNNYLASLNKVKYNNSQFLDPKFKPHTTPKEENPENPTNPTNPANPTTNSTKSIHKLILQIPKPIIPRIDDSKKDDPNAITSYNAYINQNIINQINSRQLDLKTLQSFYSQLSKSINKLLNPADMLCIAAFNRLKTLNGQISIIKVDGNQVDAQNKITDIALIKKLKGIKEKKFKDSNTTIDSQEMYDYKEVDISEKATLQNIHKYVVSVYPEQLQMSEDAIKKIKTKIEGDENKFNWILSISQTQDSQTTGANGLPSIKPGFITWINSQKKSSSSKSTGSRKKAPLAMKGADVGFIEENKEGNSENGNFTEEDENIEFIEENNENENYEGYGNVEAIDENIY